MTQCTALSVTSLKGGAVAGYRVVTHLHRRNRAIGLPLRLHTNSVSSVGISEIDTRAWFITAVINHPY
jgi:hypothetical protein